ncbi:hypothetical protein, partial [Lacticaseibacillus paracasei]|uniref:hypothetical protein n=1 Tax=Lacticaseibacillus paracasei TaxID=1597 RepID=UPI001EF3063F
PRRISRLMKELDIHSVTVNKWKAASASKTKVEQRPNLLKQDFLGSQHFFGQFAKRLFVKLGHTRKAMLLVQDSLSVLVPLRGCKR